MSFTSCTSHIEAFKWRSRKLSKLAGRKVILRSERSHRANENERSQNLDVGKNIILKSSLSEVIAPQWPWWAHRFSVIWRSTSSTFSTTHKTASFLYWTLKWLIQNLGSQQFEYVFHTFSKRRMFCNTCVMCICQYHKTILQRENDTFYCFHIFANCFCIFQLNSVQA